MRFDDVFDGRTIPLSYADNMLHSVFALPVDEAENRWRRANHRLYEFVAATEHPDLDIDHARVFRTFGRRDAVAAVPDIALPAVPRRQGHDGRFDAHRRHAPAV